MKREIEAPRPSAQGAPSFGEEAHFFPEKAPRVPERRARRVLVSGAAGFIGRHLINRLSRDGVMIRALVFSGSLQTGGDGRVQVVQGDVRNGGAMKRVAAGCDTVFHLAGKAHEMTGIRTDPAVYRSINVEGTRNLLEGAVAAGARKLVFFSSVKAMSEEGPSCLDEDSDPHPSTPYGESKLAAEALVLEYGKRAGLGVACLRLPLVYGPGNKGNLCRMIAAIDRGVFPPLPDANNRRSMVHVSNVVEAAVLSAIHPAADGQRYIVTDGEAYSTREIYELICRGLGRRVPGWTIPVRLLKTLGRAADIIGRVAGRRLPFDSGAVEKLIGSAWYSSEKISRQLGYRPTTTFGEALPELIAWYRREMT